MKTSETIKTISPALLKAQKTIGAAKKGATNPFFHSTYADLGSVMEACKEHLNENGITILQPIVNMVVETILLHETGEWISSETPIVCKEQNNPQALGSAVTYARRYGLQSMVFIPAEDDDGNSAVKTKTERPYYSPTEQKVVEPSENPLLISPKQVTLISMLLKQKGQTDEALYTKYNVKSKKDLSKVQASQIISNLNKLPDKE
jgi:hypothetical protein